MYKLFLTIRYLRKRRIAYFAIIAVALCVAMVLIVMSVMQGFLDNVMSRARGLLGDVIVDNRDYQGFPLYEEFIAEVEQWPEVVKATPVLYSYGLIHFPELEQSGTVRVVGIKLDEAFVVNAFKSSLYYETQFPGATSFAERGQPHLGVRWELLSEESAWQAHPTLPEPYQTAWEASRATGVVDPDATPNVDNPRQVAIPPGLFETGPLIGGADTAPGYTGNPLPGLIIGRDIVANRLSDGRYRRGYFLGAPANVTLLQVLPGGKVDQPIKQPFRYVDDSRTGIFEIDSQHVYCDFDLLQKLLLMTAAERTEGGGVAPARCSQIQIKLAPGLTRAEQRGVAQRMQDLYGSYAEDAARDLDFTERNLIGRITAVTWEESQAHIIAPVKKERMLVTILFGIISLVAAVLVLCILYMIALQKTRDIGIIKAIGGSSAGVALIFLTYGAAVGLVGAIGGTVFGVLFVTNINEIQAFLTSLNPEWQVWDRSVYSFDEIPHAVNGWDLIGVFVSAIVMSTVGSLLAAFRAGSMHPVEALRHE